MIRERKREKERVNERKVETRVIVVTPEIYVEGLRHEYLVYVHPCLVMVRYECNLDAVVFVCTKYLRIMYIELEYIFNTYRSL